MLIPEWFSRLDVDASTADVLGADAVAMARKANAATASEVVGPLRSPLVNMGQVMVGHFYCNRSFTIRNDSSSSSLDFSLSTAFPDAKPRRACDESEVSLSSSQYVLKLVRTLTLPPQTSKRVYIFYRPGYGLPQTGGGDGEGESEGFRETFEVTVRCRLVKDHQKVMRFMANCFRPRIGLPRKDSRLLFCRREPTSTAAKAADSTGVRQPAATEPAEGAAPDGLCVAFEDGRASVGRGLTALEAPDHADQAHGEQQDEQSEWAGGARGHLGQALPSRGVGGGLAGVVRVGGLEGDVEVEVSVAELEPRCYVAVLRNQELERLHLALSNDTLYFETALVELTPAAVAGCPELQRLLAHGAAARSGAARQGGSGVGGVAGVGVWHPLEQDVLSDLGVAVSGGGRSAPVECSLAGGAAVAVVVRLKAGEVERMSRALRKHRYMQVRS